MAESGWRGLLNRVYTIGMKKDMSKPAAEHSKAKRTSRRASTKRPAKDIIRLPEPHLGPTIRKGL
jgi:hypothetical protein